jgi:hypothetical protein
MDRPSLDHVLISSPDTTCATMLSSPPEEMFDAFIESRRGMVAWTETRALGTAERSCTRWRRSPTTSRSSR